MSQTTDGAGVTTAGRSASVADTLREKIVEGVLLPGTPLRDSVMAADFGVSRNTLREALRILYDEGLVVQRLHKGTAVKTLAADDVKDIYITRRTLELAAAEHGPLVPEPLLDTLDEKVAAAEHAVATKAWNEVGTASLRFHQTLVALLGSARMDAFFRVTVAQLRLAFAVMDDEAEFQAPWVSRDREICDLLRSGRSTDAKAALRLYLDDSECLVLDAVRADGTARRRAASSFSAPSPQYRSKGAR